MAPSISKAVEQIKRDVAAAIPGDVIRSICRQLGHVWRERSLDPVTTVHAFLRQILHGNVACDCVPHLVRNSFTGEAYCLARSRLPLELFQRLLTAICGVLSGYRPSTGWHGHRVWLVDGSSCSMPDTEELQRAFGQSGAQRRGCGFPTAHLLTLFDFSTGFLLKICAAPPAHA
jgi:hypothetical protein